MTSLADIQRRFAAGVPGDPSDALALFADDGRQAHRFEIHRNNTFASLKSVLEDAFPTVSALLGDTLFQRLSAAFVRSAPPTGHHLLDYGAELVPFIARSEPLQAMPWLADTARLDWAMHTAFSAAEEPAATPDDLAALPPESLPLAIMPLRDSARLLRSDWPVHAIHMNPRTVAADGCAPRAEQVLVIRPDADVIAITLEQAAYRFLLELDAGRPLGEAAMATQEFDPGFDLQGVLAHHLANGHFSKPRIQEPQGEAP